ncbi:MAG: adenosylmethionine--8-amino-7-oxononanoate transaminase [bacterium]|nr:adenosylmethionine--8-amino-7-oxononanoate transaminase [bacterium]
MSNLWMPFTQMSSAAEPEWVERGEGAWIYLKDGRKVFDAISSWWVTLHGHGRPEIAEAIYRQALKLEQVIAAGFTHQPAQDLARRLVEMLPEGLSRVFYSDNGSTSTEVALKMAFQYWRNRRTPRRDKFLALEGGYHGDTLGAMSVGDPDLFSPVFKPLLFDCHRLPVPHTFWGVNDIEEREAAALQAAKEALEADPEGYAALIVEPLVQGAAGMKMFRPGWLKALVELARSYGVLVIFDEVMTGFGRTGSLFACEQAGVTPDLICLSKGLTGGTMPLSVTVANEQVFAAFLGDQNSPEDPTFYHGHSYTANPLGCAAALASMDILLAEPRYLDLGEGHQGGLKSLEGHPRLSQLRTQGTIAAMQWAPAPGARYNDGAALKVAFLERGFILRPLGPSLYIIPPYCTTPDELAQVYRTIGEVLDQ